MFTFESSNSNPCSLMAKQLKILLIEDDKEIGNWMKSRICDFQNIETLQWVLNYSDAVKSISLNEHDIVILDLKLPDGNGINILKKIKSEKLNHTVFVFSVNAELKNTCLRLGANYFFDKTTEAQQMLTTLQEVGKEPSIL